jgi:hypothetical protein|tara:strand:+ start:346 stop:630 length:285 start_codon:yes stop_codon:yes gene_type:complete
MEPKMEIDRLGNKFWRLPNIIKHRTDGPAIEWVDGDKWWFLNGEQHRIDGPAIECMDGSTQWWLHDAEMTFDEWLRCTPGLTDEGKVMMKLQYG